MYIKYCETPKPQVIHKNYETQKIEIKKEDIRPVETEREVEEEKETIVPEVKEELVGKITDKDLEDAKRVMERYKVGMIDFEANKVFKNVKFYLYRSKEEEIIKIAIRILVKKKREEGRIEVIKNIGTYEVSYALERCKNDIRNNEYVIEKLIRYIELKIEHDNYWN